MFPVRYEQGFYIRFEVFTAVDMKNGVFWDVTPCGSLVFLRSVRRLLITASVVPSSDYYHPDDGGAQFLRNVGSYKSHTAYHFRRRHSSRFLYPRRRHSS
jgi:hypothetical protein